MALDRLPSIIRETKWNKRGLAKTEYGLLVPAYVASQLGFNVPGREFLERFYLRLKKEAGVLPLCPFKACGEHLDFVKLTNLENIDDVTDFWNDFNRIVGPVNYKTLMPRSKLLIDLLDGGHAVDDGASSETGFYAAEYKGKKPIVGIRSDFRLSENIAAPINPAVRYFIDQGPYNGFFFDGPNAYDKGIECIAKLSKKIRER